MNNNHHQHLIGTPYLPPPARPPASAASTSAAGIPPPTIPHPFHLPAPPAHHHLHHAGAIFHAPAIPSPLAHPPQPAPPATGRGRGRGRGSRGGGGASARGTGTRGRGRGTATASTAAGAQSLRLMSSLTVAASDAMHDDGEFSLGENSDDDDDDPDHDAMDISSDDDRRGAGRRRGGGIGTRGGRGGRGRGGRGGRGGAGAGARGGGITGRRKKVVNASQAAPMDGAAGYDYQLMSDVKERDDADDEDGPVEEQLLLRLPADNPDLVAKFRKRVEMREEVSDIKLMFSDERTGTFTFDSTTLRTKLVDLPTILETHKSYDNKQFYKMGEIAQMLLVENLPPPASASEPTVFDPILYTQWPDGISPPLRRVRRDRFRRRKANPDAEFCDDMVERLLFADLNSEETLVEVCTVDAHGEPTWTGNQGTPEAALAAMGHVVEAQMSKKAAAALAAAGVVPGGGLDKGPRTAKPSVRMVEGEVERVAVDGVRVATDNKWLVKSPSSAVGQSFAAAGSGGGGGLLSPALFGGMVPPPLMPGGSSSSASLASAGIPPPLIPPPLVPGGVIPPPAPPGSVPYLPPSTLSLDPLDLDQLSVNTDDLGSADDADVDDLVSGLAEDESATGMGEFGDEDDDEDEDEDEDDDDEDDEVGTALGDDRQTAAGAAGGSELGSMMSVDDAASRLTGTALGDEASMLGAGMSQVGTAAGDEEDEDQEEETDEDEDSDDEDEDEEEEEDEQVAMLQQEVHTLRQRVKETQAKLAGTANAVLKKRLEDTLRKHQTELEFKESQMRELVGSSSVGGNGPVTFAKSADSSGYSTPYTSAQTSPAAPLFDIPGVPPPSAGAGAGAGGRRPSVAGKGLMPPVVAGASGTPLASALGDVESTAGMSASEMGQSYGGDDDDDDMSTQGAESQY